MAPDSAGKIRGISVPSVPWHEDAREHCDPCAEFQRGERSSGLGLQGLPVHACEHVPQSWMIDRCPCGCAVSAEPAPKPQGKP